MKRIEALVSCTCDFLPVVWEFVYTPDTRKHGWYVVCTKCHRHGKAGNSVTDAVHKWNVMIERVKSRAVSAK